MTAPWQAVLDFWFLPAGDAAHMTQRQAWFAADPGFDADVRARFGPLVESALQGGLREWEVQAEGALARILLLDQFTRNIFRGTPRAYAGDVHALAIALRLIDGGDDLMLAPVQRQFVYLPLMHAEDIELQQRCVALYTALAAQDAAFAMQLDYAYRHRDIVLRFGRFPHRNAVLGRESTADEATFLQTPGSAF